MKKQTAVEWLVEQVNADCLNSTFIRPELVEQAKAMERKQLINGVEFNVELDMELIYFPMDTLLLNAIRTAWRDANEENSYREPKVSHLLELTSEDVRCLRMVGDIRVKKFEEAVSRLKMMIKEEQGGEQ